MVDEDYNTRPYNVVAIQIRRRKSINLIKLHDGAWIENLEDIKKLFKDWYQNLYILRW